MAQDTRSEDASTQMGLRPYLSPFVAWALSVGTSIGWGSFVITGNSFLSQAGPLGSALGLVVGMLVMLVVGRNYHYLIVRSTNAGGVYAYARDTLGHDYGFMIAWFLGLTYLAMLWANATSLPLFIRYVAGSALQMGPHYQVLGYEVYVSEALVSVVALVAVGLLCARSRCAPAQLNLVLVLTFAVGIVVCFVAALGGHGMSSFSFEPLSLKSESLLLQVLRIACLSPWAFIGFESISHASEEFAFPKERAYRVLASSVVVTTLLYLFITLLSVTAYPAGYPNWLAYISDLGNIAGFERYPPFFAARYYLGGVGVALLVAALFSLIATSLIGNVLALSRLVYALALDGVVSRRLVDLNEQGVPHEAVRLVLLVSVLVPFLGRTTIGWIVDVTTLGATLTYAFVSLVTLCKARACGDRLEMVTGAVGTALMALLGVLLLLPNSISTGAMAVESYFLFAVWAIAGFVCFRLVLLRDDAQRFGRTTVVWIALLTLTLVTSLSWMASSVERHADQAVARVAEGLSSASGEGKLAGEALLAQVQDDLRGSVDFDVSLVAVLFTASMGIMLSNFAIIQRRERENERQLGVARTLANTDPLTGVKNKNAYVAREEELNYQIEQGSVGDFALVVCDVNGLKRVNDTLGHKAGDEYIRSASLLICQLFKHSPVFRIGGDEFVVILRGGDFDKRDELVANLDWQSQTNMQRGDVVIAAGMADFDPASDQRVAAVFERADALMYRRKKELKLLAGQDANER